MICPSCGMPAPEHAVACPARPVPSVPAAPMAGIWAPPNPATRAEVPWGPPTAVTAPLPVTSESADATGEWVRSSLVWDTEKSETEQLAQVDLADTPPTGLVWDTQQLELDGQGLSTSLASAALPARGRAASLFVAAVLAAACAVLSSLIAVVGFDVRSEVNGALSLKANDFSSNSIVACLIIAVLMVAGAAMAASGHRFGAGVSAGAGLAGAGLLVWIVGQGLAVLDTITSGLHAKGVSYQLATTLDVGFWAAVAGAVLCLVVVVLAWGWRFNDGREPHHPAIGVFGTFSTLVLVAGLLVPVGGAALVDNFSSERPVNAVEFGKAFVFYLLAIDHQPQPPVTWILRLVLIALLAVAGLVAFLKGTRFSMGIAVGVLVVQVWLWATSVLQAGDRPFSIAGGNPGGSGVESHAITSVGIMMFLAATVIGLVAAFVVRDD